ncbi:MAG: sulfotransferase [Gemmatales bacterium]|nr:MAG: sulfotransferase [Gemmatales bacterium]
MFIWIASYPRSGNTFFRILLYRFFGIQSYSMERSRSLNKWPDYLRFSKVADQTVEEMAQDADMHWQKTHYLAGTDDYPAVYIVRDGRDAVVSYAWFALDYRGVDFTKVDASVFEKALADVIGEREPFGTWSDNVRSWLWRPKTVIVRYEDLVARPKAVMAEVGKQFGLSFVDDAIESPSFAELQQLRPKFFRRGVVGSWRDEMPDYLHERFWQLYGDMMRELGYGVDDALAANGRRLLQPSC